MGRFEVPHANYWRNFKNLLNDAVMSNQQWGLVRVGGFVTLSTSIGALEQKEASH